MSLIIEYEVRTKCSRCGGEVYREIADLDAKSETITVMIEPKCEYCGDNPSFKFTERKFVSETEEGGL